MTADFDYEGKLWGAHQVGLAPTYLGALRLRYCLDDLREVEGKILEVGCGGGAMARAIKAHRPDLHVHGCDISPNAIAAAREYADAVAYRLGDATDLPFESEEFDAVVILDVLEHLEHPERAIAEVHRVLKPEGVFHIFVPCEGDLHTLHGLLLRLGWRAKERTIGHVQQFRHADLQLILEQRGFRVRNGRWSAHYFNQLVDVAYFTWVDLSGRPVPFSVEGYLERVGIGPIPSVISVVKSGVAFASYFESRLLVGLPGSGIHLACHKKGGQA